MNLYTVILGFSDHRQGIGQCEADSPLEALKTFLKENESLEGFNREGLLVAISPTPLIHIKKLKGFWIARFLPENLYNIVDSNGDRVLGANILQSDPNGAERKD